MNKVTTDEATPEESIRGDQAIPAPTSVDSPVVVGGKTLVAPQIVTPIDRSAVKGDVITLAGTAEAGVTIELFDWLTVIGTTVADDEGAWVVTITSVEAGSHVFSAGAIGAPGERSARSNSVVVTVASDEHRRAVVPAKLTSRARRIAFTLRGFRRSGRHDDWSHESTTDEESDQIVRTAPSFALPDTMTTESTSIPWASASIDGDPETWIDHESPTALPEQAADPTAETEVAEGRRSLQLLEVTERPVVELTFEALRDFSMLTKLVAWGAVTANVPAVYQTRPISWQHATTVSVEMELVRNTTAGPAALLVTKAGSPLPEVHVAVHPVRYDVVRVRAYRVSIPSGRA